MIVDNDRLVSLILKLIDEVFERLTLSCSGRPQREQRASGDLHPFDESAVDVLGVGVRERDREDEVFLVGLGIGGKTFRFAAYASPARSTSTAKAAQCTVCA